jgi:hypothetical protein
VTQLTLAVTCAGWNSQQTSSRFASPGQGLQKKPAMASPVLKSITASYVVLQMCIGENPQGFMACCQPPHRPKITW